MNDYAQNINSTKSQRWKELSMALYKLCFDDSAEFVNFYFNKRYTEKNHFTISKNNSPVAALQVIPYMMTFFDAKISMAYLSAICTHPDFRKQGLMTKLMEKTHKQLFADGTYAAFLIPAEPQLFDVYRKNDYETVFYRTKQRINTCGFCVKKDCKIYEYSEANKHKIFEYFDLKMNERNCCIQHSFSDFETVCEDIYNSDGVILIAEYENKISGISFASRINDDIAVHEHFAETQEISASLFKTVSKKTKTDNLIYINIPQKTHYEAVGMVRIICAEKMLRLYAETNRHCKKTIFLKDSLIAENNGCYIISNAECVKLPLENSHNSWNIVQLAQFIFDKQMPYMSLMLNE
ncbi:MAG: GNAT family N-acetyltransferase [Prevotellaceae bacterium]|jgi:predicted acetyltransferase|nr:GNAT family N-acetyltransferase [Prevotellaceae bacterium]